MKENGAWCRVDDVVEGRPFGLKRNGRRYAACRVGEETYALDGVCPHRGAPLEDGFVDQGRLVCPWHGWSFDVATGAPRIGDSGVDSRRLVARDGELFDV